MPTLKNLNLCISLLNRIKLTGKKIPINKKIQKALVYRVFNTFTAGWIYLQDLHELLFYHHFPTL